MTPTNSTTSPSRPATTAFWPSSSVVPRYSRPAQESPATTRSDPCHGPADTGGPVCRAARAAERVARSSQPRRAARGASNSATDPRRVAVRRLAHLARYPAGAEGSWGTAYGSPPRPGSRWGPDTPACGPRCLAIGGVPLPPPRYQAAGEPITRVAGSLLGHTRRSTGSATCSWSTPRPLIGRARRSTDKPAGAGTASAVRKEHAVEGRPSFPFSLHDGQGGEVDAGRQSTVRGFRASEALGGRSGSATASRRRPRSAR